MYTKKALFLLFLFTQIQGIIARELTSDAIKLARIFIKPQQIGQMLEMRQEIKHMLEGAEDLTGARRGKYQMGDQKLSIHDLCIIEDELLRLKESMSHTDFMHQYEGLQKLLHEAKDEFRKKAEKHRKLASARKITAKLVRESLANRGISEPSRIFARLSSEEITDGEEERIYWDDIKRFRDLRDFLGDLFHFLGDMIDSCPDQKERWELFIQKIRRLHEVAKEHLPTEAQNRAFFSYVKENYLNKAHLEDITPEEVSRWYQRYTSNK